MKKVIYYILLLVFTSLSLSSCSDYLDKDSYQFEDDNFWTSEENLKSYTSSFYPKFFEGYAQDYYSFGGFFSGKTYSDDYLQANTRDVKFYFPIDKTKAEGNWVVDYTFVRKANVMIEKIPAMPIDDAAKANWMGIARLFRALTYSALVSEYGDVPYIDIAVKPEDVATLYKPRTSRLDVVDKIAEDFEYAMTNIKLSNGSQQVNRYVAAAMVSRCMLYHATWLQYHGTTVGPKSQSVEKSKLKEYYDLSIKGAQLLMNSNKYKITNEYNLLFASDTKTVTANTEIIFYREYVENKFMNALMAYNADDDQTQGGVTQDVVNAYLCSDGLPIGQSTLYVGTKDPSINGVMKNRDPRLYQTIADSVRVMNGGMSDKQGKSYTGYATKKFLNDEWYEQSLFYVIGRNSVAAAPNVRYAEVLLNYLEARYEVSKIGGAAFNQNDLDLSINQLRKRQLTKWKETEAQTMPEVDLAGNSLSVRGTGIVINDPARDVSVDAILWEIRRERRIELVMEGFRDADLNRWAKYEYLNSTTQGKPNNTILGAWIDSSLYPEMNINKGDGKGVNLYNPTGDNTSAGFVYAFDLKTFPARTFQETSDYKYYLKSVPIDQINLYEQSGHTLEQNPGW